MGAACLRCEEGTLQVQAQGSGRVGILDAPTGQGLEPFEKMRDRGADQRREEGGDAAVQERPGQLVKPALVGIEQVDPGKTIDLEVHESWSQKTAGLPGIGPVGLAIGDLRDPPSIIDGDPARGQEAIGENEAIRIEDCARHGRRVACAPFRPESSLRRTAILLPIAFALALGLGMFLAQRKYAIPGAKLPFLPEGTQKISRSLSVGIDRPEFTLAWSAGDFEFRSELRLEEGQVFDFYFRIAKVRKGILDFERIRFEAGAELANLGRDEVGERVQIPASLAVPLRLRAEGTGYVLELGTEASTGILSLTGSSRFAHGWFQLAGTGRMDKIEIENLGPPRNGVREMLWFFVPVLTILLAMLFLAQTWSFRFLALLALLLFSLFVTEIAWRKSPIRARAYDLHRAGQEAEMLDAFGFLHPERRLDILTGRFTDLYSVILPTRKDVYRVALLGFEAAGQEDRPPSQRWYAPLATILSERFGKSVEVIHAFHSGARPSACVKQLGPLFEKLGVDLVVWAVTPTDLESFQSPAWEPAKEGWSPILLLNASGLAKGNRNWRFPGEVQAFAEARKKLNSRIRSLGTLAKPGRAPWELAGLQARQAVEALSEEIMQALR